LKLDKTDFGGTYRSDEDVNLMALANLHGGYAKVMSCGDVLRRYTATPPHNECSPAQISLRVQYPEALEPVKSRSGLTFGHDLIASCAGALSEAEL
jgi:hypothetical protein